nr:DNA helicase [Tanacetum cinerariifolium]
MSHFGGDNSGLRRDIVEGLIDLLDTHNALVHLFRTAREKLIDSQVPNFKVHLYNVVGGREYELPAGDMLGAIVYEPGPDTKMDYDIVLEERSDGYSKDLKFVGGTANSNVDMRLTMKAYYAYFIHDCANCFNYLSRTGRLFQQYVVTAFYANEQNRIDFIREHQNYIRNEYLSGIYDAISRGDNDGSSCGAKLILPQSFIGEPRYMYCHYLDAFSICRVHGNPSFFITFTCNVKWPEITEYMADFPLLTTADHANIVDRVLEMKIHQFIKYLRDAQPFVLYTIEFQKRGLPHCHTLLWIHETARVRRDEDIGIYVSAELPSLDVDPECHRVVSELMMHGPCACQALGILEDDQECEITFQEAACSATPAELRTLFAHILTFCQVSDPVRLWKRVWKSISEDIPYTSSISHNILNLHIDDSKFKDYMLYELEACLNHCSRSLVDFSLQTPPEHLMSVLRNRLLMEEKTYNRLEQELIFVYGHGGTGKTFLWNTIIYALRAEGRIVLAVASSGVASILLPAGRTAHSRFKLPLDLTDTSICSIKKNTQLITLIKETSLIIWDESPMNGRRCFETLGSSIAESYLWQHFKLHRLTKNMRISKETLHETDKEKVAIFVNWLLDIGNGNIGVPDEVDPENTSWVDIPDMYKIPDDEHGMVNLIRFIYDDQMLQNPTPQALQEKVIVCPKNEVVDTINTKVMSMVPGRTQVYISYDEALPHGHDGEEVEMLYPKEYLNTLSFAGLPPHRLELKIGTPIILLCNLNIAGGLCNGTRLIVKQLLPKVIEAQIVTGTRISQKVYLPRIPLTMKDPKIPFIFKRKQFPIKILLVYVVVGVV